MPLGEWIASAASRRFAEYRSARLMYEEYLRDGVPSFTELTSDDFQRAAADARLGTLESSYRHVIEVSRQAKDYRNIAVAFYQLGMLFHSQGKFQDADEQFRESIDVAESLPELLDDEITIVGGCLYHLAILAARRGARDAGVQLAQRALGIYVATNDLSNQIATREMIRIFFGEADAR